MFVSKNCREPNEFDHVVLAVRVSVQPVKQVVLPRHDVKKIGTCCKKMAPTTNMHAALYQAAPGTRQSLSCKPHMAMPVTNCKRGAQGLEQGLLKQTHQVHMAPKSTMRKLPPMHGLMFARAIPTALASATLQSHAQVQKYMFPTYVQHARVTQHQPTVGLL